MLRIRTPFILGLLAVLFLQVGFVASAHANDCARYDQHRDAYLYAASQGMERMVQRMASDRGVTPEIAAFFWGGTLMQSDDPATLRTLAQLTLATYHWPDNRARAENAMARIFDERGGRFAGLLAGLMLSDNHGPRDPWRARGYLRDAARAGNADAAAFLPLYDACHGRRMAAN